MFFYVQQVDIDMASLHHDIILDVAKMDDHQRLATIEDANETPPSGTNDEQKDAGIVMIEKIGLARPLRESGIHP